MHENTHTHNFLNNVSFFLNKDIICTAHNSPGILRSNVIRRLCVKTTISCALSNALALNSALPAFMCISSSPIMKLLSASFWGRWGAEREVAWRQLARRARGRVQLWTSDHKSSKRSERLQHDLQNGWTMWGGAIFGKGGSGAKIQEWNAVSFLLSLCYLTVPAPWSFAQHPQKRSAGRHPAPDAPLGLPEHVSPVSRKLLGRLGMCSLPASQWVDCSTLFCSHPMYSAICLRWPR